MVRYEVMGFMSEDDYLNHFFRTLLKTNWTYDYFTEWAKIKSQVKTYVKEISLLNSISKVSPEHRKRELKDIFMKYPETIPLIPKIIALREQSVPVLEVGEKIFYRVFDFTLRGRNQEQAENLVDFCDKVGILSLFGEISDLYDYLLGVEVGLDSNARKNRSGEIFQHLLRFMLNKKLSGKGFHIEREDPSVQTTRSKRADFVVYYNGKPRIVIECNFYNTTGSKPIETANAYIDYQRKIRETGNCTFIWITDGPAWEKMKSTILQSFKEIDFPINYTIANECLEKIIQTVL